jgi:chemosensory pili system protein ChpC
MNAVVEKVRSLWVPLEELSLLAPNVAIAEIIDKQPLDLVLDGPEWLLGRLHWRNQELPVVSMERLLGLNPPQSEHGAQIIVFNTVSPNTRLPFFAAVTAGIPRLFNADADTLGASLHSDRNFPATVADCVELDGEEALIPDLEAIQALVEEAWKKL